MSRCAGNVIKKRCGRIRVMKQEITFDRFVRWMGMGLLVLSILLLVNYLSSVLLPFFVAWLLAYLLYPVVEFIQFKLKVKVRRSEEHTSELQSRQYLVCRLLLEKKKKKTADTSTH